MLKAIDISNKVYYYYFALWEVQCRDNGIGESYKTISEQLITTDERYNLEKLERLGESLIKDLKDKIQDNKKYHYTVTKLDIDIEHIYMNNDGDNLSIYYNINPK